MEIKNLLIYWKKLGLMFFFHHALTKNYNDNSKFNLKKSLKENTNNIEEVLGKLIIKLLLLYQIQSFKIYQLKNIEL